MHGWSDYFFQRKLARFWARHGARFYALDLHNYGRSLRPGLTPGYVTDLREYDADISAALTAMGRGPGSSQGNRRLILLGHSTGGLSPLYLSLILASTETATEADVALNVHAVAHRALSLGNNVTVVRIPRAVHDIFLSREAVRITAYGEVERWMGGYLRQEK